MTTPSEREQALLNDPQLLASVQRGLRQATDGDTHDLGTFQQYADEDDQDENEGPTDG